MRGVADNARLAELIDTADREGNLREIVLAFVKFTGPILNDRLTTSLCDYIEIRIDIAKEAI